MIATFGRFLYLVALLNFLNVSFFDEFSTFLNSDKSLSRGPHASSGRSNLGMLRVFLMVYLLSRAMMR